MTSRSEIETARIEADLHAYGREDLDLNRLEAELAALPIDAYDERREKLTQIHVLKRERAGERELASLHSPVRST
jgi:hypothetical protein